MLRNLVCAVAILGICLGVAMADVVKGKITKIDGTKITIEDKEKKATEFDAKDAKVVAGKNKDAVDGGLNALKVGQPISADVTGGKATEIVVPKKK